MLTRLYDALLAAVPGARELVASTLAFDFTVGAWPDAMMVHTRIGC